MRYWVVISLRLFWPRGYWNLCFDFKSETFYTNAANLFKIPVSKIQNKIIFNRAKITEESIIAWYSTWVCHHNFVAMMLSPWFIIAYKHTLTSIIVICIIIFFIIIKFGPWNVEFYNSDFHHLISIWSMVFEREVKRSMTEIQQFTLWLSETWTTGGRERTLTPRQAWTSSKERILSFRF